MVVYQYYTLKMRKRKGENLQISSTMVFFPLYFIMDSGYTNEVSVYKLYLLGVNLSVIGRVLGQAFLRTTSPSRLRRATSPGRGGFGSLRKVNGFARGSPTRGAGAQRLRGCTKTGLPSVARPALLRHIGNAPVHWHEETFSSGGILLSDENATVFLTSSDLQPVAPTQIATLNAIAAICFFFNRIKIFQASIP